MQNALNKQLYSKMLSQSVPSLIGLWWWWEPRSARRRGGRGGRWRLLVTDLWRHILQRLQLLDAHQLKLSHKVVEVLVASVHMRLLTNVKTVLYVSVAKKPKWFLHKHGKYLVKQFQDVVRCLTLHVSKSLLQPSSDVCTRYILLRCEVEKIKHFDRTPRLFIARSKLKMLYSSHLKGKETLYGLCNKTYKLKKKHYSRVLIFWVSKFLSFP